uniref:Profilin n=1 Tax=Rhinolophus ferrumequinum TaxID=59479 RepID=A0A671FMH2_RHIFE
MALHLSVPPFSASLTAGWLARQPLVDRCAPGRRAWWLPLPPGPPRSPQPVPAVRLPSQQDWYWPPLHRPRSGSGNPHPHPPTPPRGPNYREVMPNDVKTLVNGYAKNPLQTRREGLYFKEKDYKCVRADDYSLYAKNENTGVVVVKTQLYLLVATYTEGMCPSICVEATEKLGEYLRRKGN